MLPGLHYLPGGNDDPNPPLAASTFLDIAPSAGIRSPEKMCRLYFKGKPEPAFVAQRASAWHQQGCRVQIGNEPNHPIEQFGGGPSDYRDWFFSVKAKVPGVRCYWAGMSPGFPGWEAWYADAGMADGIAAHAYGTFAQMRAVIEFLIPIGKPIWVAECNFGAGNLVDRDAWAVQQLKPFLDWCATVPLVEAVTYFAYKWPDPDMHLPTSVDAAGTRIETVVRTWTPPQEQPVADIKGIDVSNHQGIVDMARVKASGYDFVIAKASGDEGVGNVFIDATFPGNWRRAADAGMVRGAYHYARPSKVGPAQSVTTLERAIQAAGGLRAGDLVALDAEDPDALNGSSQHQWVAEWLALAEQVFGLVPWKYSARYYTSTHDLEHADLERYPTWWASYQSNEPMGVTGWKPIRMWQHSASGTVPGVSGDVDLNVFHGTVAELRALGLPAPPGTDWETPVLAPIYQGASAVPGMPDATDADLVDATEIIHLMDKLKARHPA